MCRILFLIPLSFLEHWEGKVSKALARIADQQLNTHAQSFDES